MPASKVDLQLGRAIREMIRWRGLYFGAKATADHTQMWLDAYRHLAREKGCNDFDRLLEILDEIENVQNE